MKPIKNIDVKMTFSVGLGGYEAPQVVIDQLKEIEEKQITLDQNKEQEYPEAFEWLNAYVKDSDAYEWEYELNDLSI
ncbi:conserved hypothetical protein [Tenacibaculum sp. 190524A02b]|uniref:Uncharacterized protein n=1 Tax=Tenacibaculum vairaonense TaxID=3137860 RepID=A0ABM9PS43_9FLAO